MKKKINNLFLIIIVLNIYSCAVKQYRDNNSFNCVNHQKKERRFIIVSHRGANHLAPENTFASAKKAIENGADYVEVDVRTSKDSIFYILHDWSLNRTTNGRGWIKNKLSSEIDNFDAGSFFSKEYSQEKIPKLDNYLDWIKGKAKVYLDVKKADINKLVQLIRLKKMEDEVFFNFHSKKEAMAFRLNAPELKLKMNVSSLGEIELFKKEYQVDIVEININLLNDEIVNYCLLNNIKTMVYKRGNTKEWYCEVLNSKADMVNLDCPDIFLKMYNNTKKK